ncbi:Cytochrome P450 [Penicillium malachiteum]|uniref:Cytochrome P450 n=1 Tax=Penicillium malachiteum TaxID=1324776 RepID=UPI002547180F|nr:Cytochrome P450 [Penicillium malachiteum]KAJ5715318.1 Cytochrome P450 [Penicillium malachiteum]
MTISTERKIISVVGATGKQGGSVLRSLIQNPQFIVRCLTRDGSSGKAKSLRALGAEVAQMDGFDDDSTLSAISGSWGIFINNDYGNNELVRGGQYDQDFGNRILRNAAGAGIRHVVFSSQPSAEELTDGKIRTPILDIKAWGEAWGRANPAFTTFTPIMSSWYMEDFLMPAFYQGFGGFPLDKDPEGYLTLRSPLIGGEENVPWICIEEDFGDLVHGIFLNPLRWNRRTVQAVGDIKSWAGVVNTFSQVTKEPARFIGYEDPAAFPAFDKPELKESRDVFAFYQMRDGEIFGCGITESQTAAALKKEAVRAKGVAGARESLMSCAEWFADIFPNHK